MNEPHIFYKGGYKYQLARTYIVDLCQYEDIKPHRDIEIDFIRLNTEGILTILKGYAWDGPSGPSIDTKNSMRGSLVHDALYQLIRMGLLPRDFKKASDEILYKICREDGMSHIRAYAWKKMVNTFGGLCCKPEDEHSVIKAP